MPGKRTKQEITAHLMARCNELLDAGYDGTRILNRHQLKIQCYQCNAAIINGVACHETGCPNQAKAKQRREQRERKEAKCDSLR